MKPARTDRKPTNPNLAIGYVRVSTAEQDLGPEAQRAALAAWAQRTGAELVEVYEDRLSGTTPVDRRPGLVAALAALEVHGAGVLVVARRDRLARDTMAAVMTDRLAAKVGARIAAADGAGDGEGPEAMLLRRMLDAFAEYEAAVIRARTRAALRVKRTRGECAGTVPYGERVAADGRTLEPDASEAALLAVVRELRAAGVSIRGIVAELDKRGFRTRKGTPLQSTQVARIVARVAA